MEREVTGNRETSTAEFVPLYSATERVVAELWQEALQSEDLPAVTENFFALGGDSIAMVTVLYRIQEEFSVELPAGAILGAPSVRELSMLVDDALLSPET